MLPWSIGLALVALLVLERDLLTRPRARLFGYAGEWRSCSHEIDCTRPAVTRPMPLGAGSDVQVGRRDQPAGQHPGAIDSAL